MFMMVQTQDQQDPVPKPDPQLYSPGAWTQVPLLVYQTGSI